MEEYMKKISLLVFVLFLLMGATFVWAEADISRDQIIEDSLRHVDSHLLHRIEGYDLFGGLRFGVGVTGVAQFVHNANGDDLVKEGEDVVDGAYSLDIELEKLCGDFGIVYVHLEAGDADSVEDELKVFSNVNYDTLDEDSRIELTEVWYEHFFESLPLVLTVGKLCPTSYIDNNEYANDETTQFLGHSFVCSPTIEFAENSGGLHIGLEPLDSLGIDLLVMGTDDSWDEFFDALFVAGQVNIKPNLFGRDGNYRILGWINDQEHTKWSDSAKEKEIGFGAGVSIDQEVTDNIGVFMRYGWQDPSQRLNGLSDDFSCEHAWSAGAQFSGRIWDRDEDVVGFGFGMLHPSEEYKDANSVAGKTELHLEVYYSFKVNDHLTLTPDVQAIWRPYGRDAANGNEAITVFGVRGQVDL